MKYAVIKSGSQQFKVTEGYVLDVQKLEGKPKTKLTFNEVLLIVDGDKVSLGQPLVAGAKVTAEIVEQFKDKKIRVAKFKAKSRYRRIQGHRQQMTKIKINKITSKKT